LNLVIEELLQIVEKDPLPAADTSSHWEILGNETTVGRSGDDLVLSGSGFGAMKVGGRLGSAARLLERLTYSLVTMRLKNYKSSFKTTKRLASDLTADLTYDIWRQSVALSVLRDHWGNHNLSPKTFAVIGDGHGFLGALIRRQFPESRVYLIDLPKMLVFQAHTQEQAGFGGSMSVMSPGSTPTETTFVLPENIDLISDRIDCAINIASMQEMTNRSISQYFEFLRSRTSPNSRFYCVNRLHKELPGERSLGSWIIHGWTTMKCSLMARVLTTPTTSVEQALMDLDSSGQGCRSSITLMDD